ncbi:hypothetical protein HYV79_01770 [Candidatus Woesearchaeota archaeon]|nr:hypothetical protein [Candidatus Woesearchaeota archaeon]
MKHSRKLSKRNVKSLNFSWKRSHLYFLAVVVVASLVLVLPLQPQSNTLTGSQTIDTTARTETVDCSIAPTSVKQNCMSRHGTPQFQSLPVSEGVCQRQITHQTVLYQCKYRAVATTATWTCPNIDMMRTYCSPDLYRANNPGINADLWNALLSKTRYWCDSNYPQSTVGTYVCDMPEEIWNVAGGAQKCSTDAWSGGGAFYISQPLSVQYTETGQKYACMFYVPELIVDKAEQASSAYGRLLFSWREADGHQVTLKFLSGGTVFHQSSLGTSQVLLRGETTFPLPATQTITVQACDQYNDCSNLQNIQIQQVTAPAPSPAPTPPPSAPACPDGMYLASASKCCPIGTALTPEGTCQAPTSAPPAPAPAETCPNPATQYLVAPGQCCPKGTIFDGTNCRPPPTAPPAPAPIIVQAPSPAPTYYQPYVPTSGGARWQPKVQQTISSPIPQVPARPPSIELPQVVEKPPEWGDCLYQLVLIEGKPQKGYYQVSTTGESKECSLLPKYDSFTKSLTTDFKKEESSGLLDRVKNVQLGKEGLGIITFEGVMDVRNLDFDKNVDVQKSSVIIRDVPQLSRSAVVRLVSLDLEEPLVLKDESPCVTCNILSYEDGVLEFSVPRSGRYDVVERSQVFPEKTNWLMIILAILLILLIVGGAVYYYQYVYKKKQKEKS